MITNLQFSTDTYYKSSYQVPLHPLFFINRQLNDPTLIQILLFHHLLLVSLVLAYNESLINNRYNRHYQGVFSSMPDSTRRHEFQLLDRKPKDEVRGIQSNSFFYRSAKTWNGLPSHIVNGKHINSFKTLLDEYWKD